MHGAPAAASSQRSHEGQAEEALWLRHLGRDPADVGAVGTLDAHHCKAQNHQRSRLHTEQGGGTSAAFAHCQPPSAGSQC